VVWSAPAEHIPRSPRRRSRTATVAIPAPAFRAAGGPHRCRAGHHRSSPSKRSRACFSPGVDVSSYPPRHLSGLHTDHLPGPERPEPARRRPGSRRWHRLRSTAQAQQRGQTAARATGTPPAPRSMGPDQRVARRRVRTGDPGAGRNGFQEQSGYTYEMGSSGTSVTSGGSVRRSPGTRSGCPARRSRADHPAFFGHAPVAVAGLGASLGLRDPPFPAPRSGPASRCEAGRARRPSRLPTGGGSARPAEVRVPVNRMRHHRGQRQAEQALSPEDDRRSCSPREPLHLAAAPLP